MRSNTRFAYRPISQVQLADYLNRSACASAGLRLPLSSYLSPDNSSGWRLHSGAVSPVIGQVNGWTPRHHLERALLCSCASGLTSPTIAGTAQPAARQGRERTKVLSKRSGDGWRREELGAGISQDVDFQDRRGSYGWLFMNGFAVISLSTPSPTPDLILCVVAHTALSNDPASRLHCQSPKLVSDVGGQWHSHLIRRGRARARMLVPLGAGHHALAGRR